MAKTTTTRTRRPGGSHSAPHAEPDTHEQTKSEAAEVATETVAPPAPAETPRNGDTNAVSEDVASFDAETNAKYEQVKGGKLYIKDLQMMDVHKLHDIAKA